MKTFTISPTDKTLEKELQHKIDQKTKPLGSLGTLERIALKIGLIQQTLNPELKKPHIVVFAGDHGIVNEGVSAYPQEVTCQMVRNFMRGGAAINVFTRQHGITLRVVDAGVAHEFEKGQVLDMKVAPGTRSFLQGPAMTMEQCEEAIEKGFLVTDQCHQQGCNIIGFGEMGIGNTSSSSAIMHMITGIDLDNCVGSGTRHTPEGLQKKREIIERAVGQFRKNQKPANILAYFGGFELAMICGGILRAAELGMTILVDGFNVTAALLVARALDKNVLDYCLFAHQSEEKGHQFMLRYLRADPILKLDMRLGEGTGAAVAYPLVQSAVYFLNQMASFEEANVSKGSR